jgi:copper chaperone
MKILKFKTDINCGGCIAAVTTLLNKLKGIEKWEVDTTSPDKVLTVQTNEGLSPDQIISALEIKGYNAAMI